MARIVIVSNRVPIPKARVRCRRAASPWRCATC